MTTSPLMDAVRDIGFARRRGARCGDPLAALAMPPGTPSAGGRCHVGASPGVCAPEQCSLAPAGHGT